MEGGVAVGTLEVAYAERLVPGDRFVLDGRVMEFRRLVKSIVHTRPHGGEPSLPRWTSDRQSLSCELARELAAFRAEAGRRLVEESAAALRSWLIKTFGMDAVAAEVLLELFEAQAQWSEIPGAAGLLVEKSPSPRGEGLVYTFHAPLHRAACEALARATVARLGRRFVRNLALAVADLGWSIHVHEEAAAAMSPTVIALLLDLEGFADDVLEGLDRGELPARRFRHVAATALMVLRNPEPGRRVRVGGLNWVSTRLYPLVKSRVPRPPVAPRDAPRGPRRCPRPSRRNPLVKHGAGRSISRTAGSLSVRRRLDRDWPDRSPMLRAPCPGTAPVACTAGDGWRMRADAEIANSLAGSRA